jgi:periplasmic copper chaperone A
MRLFFRAGVLTAVCSTSASAHVVFNQSNLAPNALATLELRVTHSCDGASTKEVRVKIPDGVTRVTPRAVSGWQVAVTKRRLPQPVTLHGETVRETIDTVTWSGGSFPDFAYQQFEVRAMMPNEPGKVLYFPVEQICETGKISWSQIPTTPSGGASVLKEPAPFLTLTGAPAAPARGGHRH